MAEDEAPEERADGLTEELPRAAAVVAALGGLLGLIYAIGGAVMWLRFHEAGFPADQAVALMSKTDLLVVGLRVLVIPSLAAAIVLAALGSHSISRQRQFERLTQELDDAKPEDEAAIKCLECERARLAEPPRPLALLPARARRPAIAGLITLAAVLVLVVPFSPAAFAWPVVLVGLVAYWLRLRVRAPIGSGRQLPVLRIAVAGLLGAAVISVARQTDPPARLPSVQAFIVEVPGLASALDMDASNPRAPVALSGTLIASAGDTVSIGDPADGRIITVPRDKVTSMITGPPLDQRAPPQSLLSRVLGGDAAWAVTPLEIWCVHQRYSWSWNSVVHHCGGRPRIDAAWLSLDRTGELGSTGRMGREAGIAVACPSAAPEPACKGFLSLRFPPLRARDGDAVLVANIQPQPFAIARGKRAAIMITLDRRDARLLCGVGWLNIHALLTLDAIGEAKLRDTPMRLARPRPPHCLATPEKADKPAGKSGKPHKRGGHDKKNDGGDDPAGGGNDDAGPSDGGGGGDNHGGRGGGDDGGGHDQADGEPTPTPTPTATPTPTPSPEPTPVPSGPTPAPQITAIPLRTATPTPAADG